MTALADLPLIASGKVRDMYDQMRKREVLRSLLVASLGECFSR